MEACTVLIVGGGPAGSTCARQLTAQGIDVLIIDKARFPRDKVCAGWITPAIVHSLQLDTVDYAHGRVWQPFTQFKTGLIGHTPTLTDYGQPVSYGIRRCEFDAYLLDRCGARLSLGEAFRSMEQDGDAWVINGRYRAQLVIGAGGHFCPVARAIAPRAEEHDEPVVLAQEVEFELKPEDRERCPVSGVCPELYFCPDLAGYGWIVRKGDYLNIGLGREGERNLSTQLEAFLTDLRQRGRLTVGIPQPFKGHAYRLRRHAPQLKLPPRVLLIGDAWGLAYPQSGEGIRPAIESGWLAAKVIHVANGDFSQPLAERLNEECRQRFGSGAARPDWSPPWMKPWRQWAAARCMQSRWFHRRILLDRWFLHSQQRAL
ncbi:MAG TPA: FAD-dependent oxidoreductase [Planctomycetaceae bacterium]|nr:FAD-dependent oxidoreductase [Planctomycetaceae bacterium]